MTAAEDQPHAAGGSPAILLLRGAALAAELLKNACAPGSGDPLRLEVTRTLARDLKGELEALAAGAARRTGAELVEGVEGALRAADVANLAACAVPELPKARVPEAAAATYLAAGAVRALNILIQANARDIREYHAPYAIKDAWAAAWRAGLAARQVDEFLGETG